MKNSILTIIGFIEGYLYNLTDLLFPITRINQSDFLGYRILKTTGDQTRLFKKCGIYVSPENETVFLKKLIYRRKNLEYKKMMNEINILEKVRDWRYVGDNDFEVSFPKIKKIFHKEGESTIVENLAEGSDLRSASVLTQMSVIKNCLHAFEALSREMKCSSRIGVAKVTPIIFLISFPIYWTKMVLRDATCLAFHIKILSMFYRQALSYWMLFPEYILAHKDLQRENIIINEKSIVILDLEMCAMSEEKTDLAIVAMHHAKELGLKNTMDLLDEFVNNDTQKKKFLALTIYYSVLTLATCERKSDRYIKVKQYLEVLVEDIVPFLEFKLKNN